MPFASPGYLPEPGIEPTYSVSPASQADSLPAEPTPGRGVVIKMNRPRFFPCKILIL